MLFPKRPMHRPLPTLLSIFASLTAATGAHAAAVNVTVTDQSGKALAGAVVALEPVAGKLPVNPMVGIEISQTKRQFQPHVTLITAGTPVTFPNFDTVRHHVYSFSPIKAFELKLYAGVPNVPVVFDKPGVAVLGCNIHDRMAAWVVVVDTPHFARSTDSGKARLEGVATGNYRLRVWHPALGVAGEAPVVAIAVGPTDVEQGVRLNFAGIEP